MAERCRCRSFKRRPNSVAAAAGDLARIGSTITSANTAALGPTSGVLAPGADEVSASIAALFDAHSQVYQALSAQAAAFHSQFVQLMNGGAAQYAFAEAANTSPLQTAAAPGVGGRAGTGGERRRRGHVCAGRARGTAGGGGDAGRGRSDAGTGRHAGRGGSGGIGDAGIGQHAGRRGAGGDAGLRFGEFAGRHVGGHAAGSVGGDTGRHPRRGPRRPQRRRRPLRLRRCRYRRATCRTPRRRAAGDLDGHAGQRRCAPVSAWRVRLSHSPRAALI